MMFSLLVWTFLDQLVLHEYPAPKSWIGPRESLIRVSVMAFRHRSMGHIFIKEAGISTMPKQE